ncbi:MAG TPA: undecaprenyl-diphosphate phosphatase [Pedomonas sp.]|uniref:undecaprenyl-diphosphate phosphatase n=1 Tax=Pedomonas sp. TaxID=2976421 RepID=UPI002F4111E5
MEFTELLKVILLGLVEGLTEFIPVSSTGHLVLGGHFLGFEDAGNTFKIAIQFGAILAICVAYREKLAWVTTGLVRKDRDAWRFTTAVLLGFLPAALIGVVAYKNIKALLENPWGVAWALVIGGILILIIERMVKKVCFHRVEDFTPGLALRIGLVQCLAMVPGVSRSGATIMGSLLMGVDRKAAAEFSFFLAVPTMLGATVYDLYKQWDVLNFDQGASIAIGFVVAFISALVVVRSLVNFVGKHGFAPFAWYRIVIGSLALGLLALGY